MKKTGKATVVKGILLGCLALALLIGGVYYAYDSFGGEQTEDVVVSRQREYMVERGNIVAGFDGSGKIVLSRKDLHFERMVTIKEIYVQVGQKINPGDQIALATNGKVLFSDTAGIVCDIGYEKGDYTTKETPVVTIAQAEDPFAEIAVPQDYILDVENGQTVYLWTAAHQGVKFQGTVEFVNYVPTSDSGTPSYAVRVKLDATDEEMLDGMTVSAQFIQKEKLDILTLSNKAIVLQDGKTVVRLKTQDGLIVEQEIETGFSDGKKTEILSGLTEGDTVVVGGESNAVS